MTFQTRSEELGFRGYMQVPLEKRYGPLVGIAISAIVFMLFHLNQVWAYPVFFHLFAVGLLWGTLAYASGSLIPGIISHTLVDIVSFSYWWTNFAGTYDKLTIAETGIDSHLIVWSLILVASVVLCIGTLRKTLSARRQT